MKNLVTKLSFLALALLVVLSATGCGATPTATESAPATTQAVDDTDPLQFPMDAYSEETVTVTTSEGDREVTYRLYSHLPYVVNPVDADYQSRLSESGCQSPREH